MRELRVTARRTATAPESIDLRTGARAPVCVDCGEAFAYLAAEIEARRSRGRLLPTRCAGCRGRFLADREADRARRFREGRFGPAPARLPGPDGGALRVYPGACATCGRAIRLPFDPSPDRPVFCRSCLEARAGR
ncbi:MAG TPA: CxxC-x17-CxxC domain-containing protein [Thermomicrobiales bacterium]|nr:CxxC-x17-CxxC domain-containing protein [Thermomicrobiales bacterium]